MAKQADFSSVFQARCTCGTEAPVRVGSFGKPLTCKVCHATFVVIWGIDPKSKKAVPITTEKSSTPTRVFKIPIGMYELPCPCGQNFYARPREAGKRVQCPVCGTWLKLENTRDPQTMETRIRVVKSRLNQLPAVPPPSAKPAAPAQEIICACGDSLHVDPDQMGKQAQCPGCGALIALGAAPRIVGHADPNARQGIDEALNLDDFQ